MLTIDHNKEYVIYRGVAVPVNHIENTRRLHGEGIYLEETPIYIKALDYALKKFIKTHKREPDYKRGEYFKLNHTDDFYVNNPIVIPIQSVNNETKETLVEYKLKPLWFRIPRKR